MKFIKGEDESCELPSRSQKRMDPKMMHASININCLAALTSVGYPE